MRGPTDAPDEMAEQGESFAVGAETKRRRPPGGKALLRQLQLLESAGFMRLAVDQIEKAVSDGGQVAAGLAAVQFTAAPASEALQKEMERSQQQREGAESFDVNAGSANVEAIGSAYMEAGQRLGQPSETGPQWRSLGPTTIPGGQTYGASRVNVSGRVSAIAVDPSNAAHVLVGGANGGVWESQDNGNTWNPRTDYAATTTVGAIVFDKNNPSVVYCGTGEGNWWSWLGAGILRSTDGGTTWDTLCTAPFVGQGFYDLLVDPGDSNHLLAATTGGLYTSTDGGVTWNQRRTVVTWSLSIAPTGGAAAEILAGCRDGLYRSTNGGAAWTKVALSTSPASFDRLAVAIAPSNPAVAYAWGASGSKGYLWRRATTTWAAVSPPPGVNTGQAWYDWYVAVAPDRDSQIYVGAIDLHRGDFSNRRWQWTNLSTKSSGDSVHPDQHAIAFVPGQPDKIYAGNDGGLFTSVDRGITWEHCNNGLVISEFEYLAQHPGSSRWLIGGTQDNGTARWTGNEIWDHIADGDGGDCGVNQTVPPTVFHTYYGMSPETSPHSGDMGTWNGIQPPVPSGEGSLFYPPFESSATDGDTVAIGGDALYISRNNGTNWVRLAFPSTARSSALHIPTSNAVYVGSTDGRIFQTGWNGSSWTALKALAAPRVNAYVSDLYVDPKDPQRMWATHRTVGGGRVFFSADGGASWQDRTTTGLPNLPINAIEMDMQNHDRIWVAADLGVYESLDGGQSWNDFSNGLPHAYVGDLVFHPQARVLRAGTRNRGVWEIEVDAAPPGPVSGVQFTGHLEGNASDRWFTSDWPASWQVIWTVMPTTVRSGSPQVTWNVQVERSTADKVTYWITVTNLTSDPVDFEGRYTVLSQS